MSLPAMKCQLCGFEHDYKCTLIKAYEYFPDGKVKRVEFITSADFLNNKQAQDTLMSMPVLHGTRQ